MGKEKIISLANGYLSQQCWMGLYLPAFCNGGLREKAEHSLVSIQLRIFVLVYKIPEKIRP